ncbi:hypothetical protein ACU4GD_27745 [Cupriavidus basilensis]
MQQSRMSSFSLIEAVNVLAIELASLGSTNEISYPHPHAKMVQTGREAKLLWSVSHEKSEEPRVFIGLYARLEGDKRNVVSVRLAAESYQNIENGELTLYSGLAADKERLTEEIRASAASAFAFGVRLLTDKIARQSL